ncbi:MAG: hypothetical protein HZB16_23080 [Armatimonadetes bacterium]|nr:hypothetical protein [Armatimonadota bacterium]
MSAPPDPTDPLDRSVADPRLSVASLPLVGRRPLADHEASRLVWAAGRGWLGWAAFLAIGAVVHAIQSPPDDPNPLVSSALMLAVAVGLLSPMWRSARRLRGAWVYCFEGLVPTGDGECRGRHRAEALLDGRVILVDGEPSRSLAPDAQLSRHLTLRFGPQVRREPPWWPEDSAADGSGLWCLGMPRVATRPLSAAERDHLAQRLAGHRARFWTYLLLPPAYTTVALALAMRQGEPWAVGAALAGVVAWVVGWVAALEHRRWAAALRPAWSGGTLSAFAQRNPEGPHLSLQVLDGGLIWAVDGYLARDRELVGVAAVAPTPASAEMAAQFMEPTTLDNGRTMRLNRRALTPEELIELRGMARPLRWYGGGVVTALMAVQSIRTMWLGVTGQPSYLLASLLFSWLALRLSRVLAQQLVLYRVHRADMASGFVVQLDPSESPDQAQAAGVPPGTRFIEVLPHTNRVWTLDAQPAPWRAHRSARW